MDATMNAVAHDPGAAEVDAAPSPESLESLRAALPEAARDLRLNLSAVLQPGALTAAQRWGVAVACAVAARSPRLTAALQREAAQVIDSAVLDDAHAAAALMAMNNIYYRMRHFAQRPELDRQPARLRMQRLGKPAAARDDFELFCLAVSAINGCETCVRSHTRVLLEAGMSDEQLNDAARIAATVHAVAVALELPAVPSVAG